MKVRPLQSDTEATRATVLLAQSDSQLPAPRRAGHVATDDERDERPSFSALRQHVEVVPLGPRVAIGDAVRRKMEMIYVVPQLEEARRDPSPITFVVVPLPGHDLRSRAHRACRRRNLTGRA